MLREIWLMLREELGCHLICWTLRVLPHDSTARAAIGRGLTEQRDYDRYHDYTRALNAQPIGFDAWRRQIEWNRAPKWGFPGHVPTEVE